MVAQDTTRRNARYFYILSIGIIFALPLLFLFIYEKFAGGLLNGIWGSYRTGVVSGDTLTGGVYPIAAIIIYGIMVYYTREIFIKRNKYSLAERIGMSVLFLLATIVTLLVVLWRQVVT